ncbi:MAG: N-acetylglucosamine-6-phosphate deacetylase [Candidatus Omnitrophica bacterium]|nr:N-acetylglucosamine-6-phosphate deacetylase [Candidatus Omnitrophota bacterium]
MVELSLAGGKLVTPRGIIDGALGVNNGRIGSIRGRPPRGAKSIHLHGAYLVPGFIDLHVWGEPQRLSRDLARSGTTAFLRTIGPEAAKRLADRLIAQTELRAFEGAQCLGAHLEGPFVNPDRAGALPKRWMRPPRGAELRALGSTHAIRLMTIAPELPGAMAAIRWCRRRGIVASLGHSAATTEQAERAVNAGASAATHVFNGMPAFHHRRPSLLDAALTDNRLTAMVILDGVHVSPSAFRLLVRAKGVDRVALVTDSIRYQGWNVVKRRGAYFLKTGTLAGSALTMMRAVQHAVAWGGVSLLDAVRMASEVPARLLGDRGRGVIAVGKRADLVAFDKHFRVLLTVVGGQIIHQR